MHRFYIYIFERIVSLSGLRIIRNDGLILSSCDGKNWSSENSTLSTCSDRLWTSATGSCAPSASTDWSTGSDGWCFNLYPLVILSFTLNHPQLKSLQKQVTHTQMIENQYKSKNQRILKKYRLEVFFFVRMIEKCAITTEINIITILQ